MASFTDMLLLARRYILALSNRTSSQAGVLDGFEGERTRQTEEETDDCIETSREKAECQTGVFISTFDTSTTQSPLCGPTEHLSTGVFSAHNF